MLPVRNGLINETKVSNPLLKRKYGPGFVGTSRKSIPWFRQCWWDRDVWTHNCNFTLTLTLTLRSIDPTLAAMLVAQAQNSAGNQFGMVRVPMYMCVCVCMCVRVRARADVSVSPSVTLILPFHTFLPFWLFSTPHPHPHAHPPARAHTHTAPGF